MMADGRKARDMQRFFKTGPGEYAEGDVFAGVSNPQVREVVKMAWRNTSLDDAVALVRDPVHEVRLCGLLIMVQHYLKSRSQEIVDAYLSLHTYINNWDLVDLSAIKIIGNHEADHPEWTLMDEWIKPDHTLWQRRIAMVSTWITIRRGRLQTVFDRARLLIDAPEPLLHKATGWMLREAWKHGGEEAVRQFLDSHVRQMPAVMLSYTCEKMPPDERRYWQLRRKEIENI